MTPDLTSQGRLRLLNRAAGKVPPDAQDGVRATGSQKSPRQDVLDCMHAVGPYSEQSTVHQKFSKRCTQLVKKGHAKKAVPTDCYTQLRR